MPLAIDPLAKQVAAALIQKKLKLAIAESCTGGGLCYYLTNIAGSSDWFERGFITYSNAAKIELLHVKPDTLNQHGAVSEQTAREMAAGTLTNSQADISISITGIAGPAGGSADKPIGTVWMAMSGKNMNTTTQLHVFKGDRQTIREHAIANALEYIIAFLKDNP